MVWMYWDYLWFKISSTTEKILELKQSLPQRPTDLKNNTNVISTCIFKKSAKFNFYLTRLVSFIALFLASQSAWLGLGCIDECHCLVKWGHSFRPDYLKCCILSGNDFKKLMLLFISATVSKSTEAGLRSWRYILWIVLFLVLLFK